MMYGFEPLIWNLTKILFLFAFLIYMIFAVVVVRQFYLMTTTIKVGFEFPLRLFAWVHLFAAILVFLFALAAL